MEFSRQEYWSGLCCHFLLQGIFLTLLSLSPALAGGFFTTSTALTAGGHTVENPDGTQEPRTPVQSHLPLSAGLLWTSFLTHVCGMCVLSHVRLFAAPWTVACQAPLSREFSRQQYWSGLPFPTPGDHPNPGNEPASPASPALAGGFYHCATWEAPRPTQVPPKSPCAKQEYFEELLIMKEYKQIGNLEGYKCGYSLNQF